MDFLFITGLTPEGHYRECSYGGPDLEACFEALTILINAGWQLIQVRLKSSSGSEVWLPIEAFDGQPVVPSLLGLQHQWQVVLQER